MKKKILALVSLLALTPYLALAAVNTDIIEDLINSAINILNGLLPLFLALAGVYFVWGVLQFVSSGDDEEARKSARSRMIHGIIAIFVMISLWGFVNILVDTLNLKDTIPDIPEVDGPTIP